MTLLPPPPTKFKGMLLAAALLVVMLLFAAVFGERGVIDLRRLQDDQQRWEQAAFEQQASNAALREHIRRLRSDDRYLERWARRRLHWARPDEIIYRSADEQLP
jgi:cell division protein FtsB